MKDKSDLSSDGNSQSVDDYDNEPELERLRNLMQFDAVNGG
jgi:hypothetical protein